MRGINTNQLTIAKARGKKKEAWLECPNLLPEGNRKGHERYRSQGEAISPSSHRYTHPNAGEGGQTDTSRLAALFIEGRLGEGRGLVHKVRMGALVSKPNNNREHVTRKGTGLGLAYKARQESGGRNAKT